MPQVRGLCPGAVVVDACCARALRPPIPTHPCSPPAKNSAAARITPVLCSRKMPPTGMTWKVNVVSGDVMLSFPSARSGLCARCPETSGGPGACLQQVLAPALQALERRRGAAGLRGDGAGWPWAGGPSPEEGASFLPGSLSLLGAALGRWSLVYDPGDSEAHWNKTGRRKGVKPGKVLGCTRKGTAEARRVFQEGDLRQ